MTLSLGPNPGGENEYNRLELMMMAKLFSSVLSYEASKTSYMAMTNGSY